MSDIDVDQLFASRSVDEVAGVSRSTQREVAATQLELRTLIGQQYRELLDCTDLVVGMDDVCGEIHSRWKALANDEAGNLRTARGRDTTGVSVMGTDELSQSTAEELRFGAFSSLSLLRAGRMQDAAVQYNRTAAALSRLAQDEHFDMAAVADVERMLSTFPLQFEARASEVVLDIASTASDVSSALVHDDLHNGVELLKACGRNQALTFVLDLHASVMRRCKGEERAPRMVAAAIRALAYINRIAGRSPSQLASAPAQGKPLHSLLDTNFASDVDFENALREHIVGLGCLEHAVGGHASPLDGWQSPMPPNPPPIDPSVSLRVVTRFAEQFEALVAGAASVATIVKLDAAVQDAVKRLMWTLEGSVDCQQAAQQLLQRVVAIAADGALERATGTYASCCESVRAALATGETAPKPGNVVPHVKPSRLEALLQSKFERQPDQSKVKHLCVDAVAQTQQAEAALPEKQKAALRASLKASSDRVLEEGRRTLLRLRGADESSRGTLSLTAASVLFEWHLAASAVASANEAGASSDGNSSATVDLLRQLLRPWAQRMARDVGIGSGQWSCAAGTKTVQWDQIEAGGAKFDIPARPSAWVFKCTLGLKRSLLDAFADATSIPLASAVLADEFLTHTVEDLLKDAAESDEAAALQLAFDLRFMCHTLGVQHAEAVAVSERKLASAEPSTVSVIRGNLDRVLQEASGSCSLLFSLQGSPLVDRGQRQRAESRRLPQARDAPRISNVPLPSAPKALSRLADVDAGISASTGGKMSAASPSAATSGSNTLRSLKNIMGGW